MCIYLCACAEFILVLPAVRICTGRDHPYLQAHHTPVCACVCVGVWVGGWVRLCACVGAFVFCVFVVAFVHTKCVHALYLF